ncbi:MAG: HEAT repeat domain-containing protein [Armatimonadetes bacterium]|nr:HEAT repeat domain-containing protein [Armatimonadota bacterium]
MAKSLCRLVVSLAVLTACSAPSADAYPVAYALSLSDLTAKADVVAKVEVVSGAAVADPWFTPVGGFVARATTMRPIACYRGGPLPERFTFRHYAPAAESGPMMYMPQWYKFADARCYLVWAARTDQPGVLRQMEKGHRTQEDQGVVLCADADPHLGLSVDRVVLAELTGLLRGREVADVLYGLDHLDEFTSKSRDGKPDFVLGDALPAVLPLIRDARDDVAKRAITFIGGHNPYLSPGDATFWLASVAGANLPGLGPRDLTAANAAGQAYWRQLAAVADSRRGATVRAAAIRALGHAKVPELAPLARRWAADADPTVRAAAAVLLADYPDQVPLLRTLTSDKQAAVRAGAAQAVGFGQMTALLPELARLLDDPETSVSSAAAASLLSFPLTASRTILTARAGQAQWGCLFVNALAKEEPGRYLTQLAQIVRTGPQPEGWWGGRIPWGESWDILFAYTKRQDEDVLRLGGLDEVLDALESPARPAGAAPSYYSSSEPRDLYALYVQRGLTARAKAFRERCVKAMSYDIDQYFRQVDANPGLYRRE